MKIFIVIMALLLAVTPVLAGTGGAQADFLTEFDITFWQTLPFAVLWSSAAASQFGAASWAGALGFSVGASALNAFLHARKTTAARSQSSQ